MKQETLQLKGHQGKKGHREGSHIQVMEFMFQLPGLKVMEFN